MRHLGKFVFLIWVSVFLFSGCTIYTEKQSESLSQSVYATKDSIDCGRFDLADEYSTQTTRLVRPPKNKIEILPVYKTGKPKEEVKQKTPPTQKPSILSEPGIKPSRTVVIPPRFGNDEVVVVGTAEYDQLLQNNKIATQIKTDYNKLQELKISLDSELQKQYEMRDKMVQDLLALQKKLVEKELAILRRNIIIFGLLGSICVGVYLRIKNIL